MTKEILHPATHNILADEYGPPRTIRPKAEAIPPIVKDYLRYIRKAATCKSHACRTKNRRLANEALMIMNAKAADIAVRLEVEAMRARRAKA